MDRTEALKLNAPVKANDPVKKKRYEKFDKEQLLQIIKGKKDKA